MAAGPRSLAGALQQAEVATAGILLKILKLEGRYCKLAITRCVNV